MSEDHTKLEELSEMSIKVNDDYVAFSPQKTNVRIYMTDNFQIEAYREKPFNRFQRWMMWTCFGWKVEVIE